MIFAQIKDNVIVNTIIIDDVSILPLFQNNPTTGEPYDTVLQIDMIYPRPGIGWMFDNITFVPPIIVEIIEIIEIIEPDPEE